LSISDASEPVSETHVGTKPSRLIAYLLPFAVAAAFAGPSGLREIRRRYQLGAQSTIVDIAWDLDEEYSEQLLERITDHQVRTLNQLLALPYTNDHGFEYFADE
jgi:hypothetical protein